MTMTMAQIQFFNEFSRSWLYDMNKRISLKLVAQLTIIV